ncbi:MAG: hypothetical protein SAK29_03905 [Scytonema sp. PMC 1069.18]|nr:hypothetical protein [Scytonema sp. PMC 1069.18]MEC4881014.1 hypothetical protein [Scytonema sp. PMC 1070.18]
MTAPLVATSTLSAVPAQAATLASAFGDLHFTNFSQNFATVDSDNDGDTSGSADGGVATVYNQAVVETDDAEAWAYATSEVTGESRNYSASAQTQATIVGNFFINAGNVFSFNFQSFLDLEAMIDEPSFEKASAITDISFSLYDTSDIRESALADFLDNLLSNPTSIKKNPLAFFSLAGNLNIPGRDDFLKSRKSENITFNIEDSDSNFGGNYEFASAFFAGYFQQRFNTKANLTLVASRRTEARVVAPEPGATMALLALPVLMSTASKGRNKGTSSSGRCVDRKVTRFKVGV